MSYYRQIPEHIVQDPELIDSEKLFYGLINALVTRYGYCWATNAFLAKESGKKPRQVRNYLKKFNDKKLIIIEIEQNKYRKIWLPETYAQKDRIQKILKPPQVEEIFNVAMDCHPGGNGLPPIGIIDKNTRKEKQAKDASPSADAVYIFLLSKIQERHTNFKPGDRRKCALEIESMMKNDKRSEEDVRKVIAWIFSQEEGFWKKSIPRPKFLRRFFDDALAQMSESKKIPQEEKNKEFIKKVLEENDGLEHIVIPYSSNLEIKTQSAHVYSLAWNENGFESRFESLIRKMGMVIQWPKK